jgi:hypothetical protein
MNNEIGELESIEATLEQTTYFENATIDPYKIKIKSIYSNGQSFDITWHIPEGYNPDGENNGGNLNSRSISPTNITAVNKNNKKQSLQIYIPPTSTEGNYKIHESGIINNGISNTTSYRYNFYQSDIPYFKNNFQTRIAFSDIEVNDAFKNG